MQNVTERYDETRAKKLRRAAMKWPPKRRFWRTPCSELYQARNVAKREFGRAGIGRHPASYACRRRGTRPAPVAPRFASSVAVPAQRQTFPRIALRAGFCISIRVPRM